jgi:hypothetical protein
MTVMYEAVSTALTPTLGVTPKVVELAVGRRSIVERAEQT